MRARTARWRFALVLPVVAGCALAAKALEQYVGLDDPAMVFLAGVLTTAVLWGLGPSIAAALVSMLVYDLFFVDPLLALTVSKTQDLVSLIVFLAVAVLTSHLATRARDQADAAAIERTRVAVVLEEKAKTEQVIEASEDGILVLDGEGRVAHVNEVACAILGAERAAVQGRPFDELASSHPHYLRLRERVREMMAHPGREEERIEVTLFLRGRDHHYVLRTTPFRTREAARPGLILVLQDITYVRDQEERREHLVATLSHELRTPLTSLRMAVELMRQRPTLPDDLRELADTAHEDVVRLQDVSQQFLDLARSRATAIAVERGPVDCRELVARAVRLFAIQAKEKGIALDLVAAPVAGLLGDETKLTWALSNLLANAVRYTNPGGHVRVELSGADHRVLVSVADDGPGIPADQQERIFERFAQHAGGELGSAGLGLAIVRDIVQAHGGRIHLDSEPGRGTRFTLDLPATETAEA